MDAPRCVTLTRSDVGSHPWHAVAREDFVWHLSFCLTCVKAARTRAEVAWGLRCKIINSCVELKPTGVHEANLQTATEAGCEQRNDGPSSAWILDTQLQMCDTGDWPIMCKGSHGLTPPTRRYCIGVLRMKRKERTGVLELARWRSPRTGRAKLTSPIFSEFIFDPPAHPPPLVSFSPALLYAWKKERDNITLCHTFLMLISV